MKTHAARMKVLKGFEMRVQQVVERADVYISSPTVAVLLSLRTASSCDYESDQFIKLDKSTVRTRLRSLAVLDDTDVNHDRQFFGGIVYNNALLRMSTLYERGLRLLYRQEMQKRGRVADDNADTDCLKRTLVEFFPDRSVRRIDKVRREINRFKHAVDAAAMERQVETFEDACRAFDELLDILTLLDAAIGASAPRATSAAQRS